MLQFLSTVKSNQISAVVTILRNYLIISRWLINSTLQAYLYCVPVSNSVFVLNLYRTWDSIGYILYNGLTLSSTWNITKKQLSVGIMNSYHSLHRETLLVRLTLWSNYICGDPPTEGSTHGLIFWCSPHFYEQCCECIWHPHCLLQMSRIRKSVWRGLSTFSVSHCSWDFTTAL